MTGTDRPRTIARRSLGPGLGIASAALFGASTPLAKRLLADVDPWLLAGVLYLGSGIGLALLSAAVRLADGARWREAALGRAEAGWLALAIGFGGVLAPVLLMCGLVRTSASAASLLLTLETVFTALLAWFAFGENVDARIAAGLTAITAGALLIGWTATPTMETLAGPALIAGACLAWAVDNNFTRKVALADPVHIALVKGCVAGAINVGLAIRLGAAWPAPEALAGAALVGFVGYGVSLVLFVLALRLVGTARTGAYFSVAPFFGAAAAMGLLAEPPTIRLGVGGALMGLGVWLHLTERHEHGHEHAGLAHEHRHVHDAHHRHPHEAGVPPGEPHTHRHTHARLGHAHPHFPDAHHHHGHG
jgi:drug/metabolite transporter (DMT)-like permease